MLNSLLASHSLNDLNSSELDELINNFSSQSEKSLYKFHQFLAMVNRERYQFNTDLSPERELFLDALRNKLDAVWLKAAQDDIQPLLQNVPSDPVAFVQWMENLQAKGPGQHHELFEFLATEANQQDFEDFMSQELATEAGFDDLVALTQIQAPHTVKLELARNYWDELGNGTYEKMHSVLLGWVGEKLNITPNTFYDGIHWQALALANLMIAFASRRSYFYQSIGALGAIELTAPSRCVKVTQGLKRLGFENAEYRYYSLHSVLDIKHWNGWRDNAIRPLIEAESKAYKLIAEGMLLRLMAGKLCYDVYAEDLIPNTLALAS